MFSQFEAKSNRGLEDVSQWKKNSITRSNYKGPRGFGWKELAKEGEEKTGPPSSHQKRVQQSSFGSVRSVVHYLGSGKRAYRKEESSET